MSSSFLGQIQDNCPHCLRFAKNGDDLKIYTHDRTSGPTHSPEFVLFPESTSDVVTIIQAAQRYNQPLTVSGGRTGLAGAATSESGEVIVSFEKMNRFLEYKPETPAIRMEAGRTTQFVQNDAAGFGHYFPVDFASKSASQIGGNLATHAGGIHVFRYGSIREYVLGLTAVDGTGNILTFSDLQKDNTGYHLKELLIGSEGTLALITEVTLRLISPPPETQVALLGFHDLQSIIDMRTTLHHHELFAFEFFDANCLDIVCSHYQMSRPFDTSSYYIALIEYRKDDVAIEAKLAKLPAIDIRISVDPKQYRQFWQYREGISEAISLSARAHKIDVSLPVSQLPAFVDHLKTNIINRLTGQPALYLFGHIGDGNLHINLTLPKDSDAAGFYELSSKFDQLCYTKIVATGGSISAEHGIGRLKKQFLPLNRTSRQIQLMRSIKQAFDPANILNRGRIFDTTDTG